MSQNTERGNRNEMRDSIVKSASQVFTRFGFKKTSMDDIARSIRMGKSSIYYYFKSKEEVFQAVVDVEASTLRIKVDKILESGEDAMSKLRAYVKLRMDLIRQLSNYMEILKNDDLKNLALAERIRKKYDDEEVALIQRLLEEGSDRGLFKVKDLNLSALAIATAMKGLEIPFIAMPNGAECQNMVIDDALDILFYGIVKR